MAAALQLHSVERVGDSLVLKLSDGSYLLVTLAELQQTGISRVFGPQEQERLSEALSETLR